MKRQLFPDQLLGVPIIGAMRSVVQIHSPRLTEPEALQRVRLRGFLQAPSPCCEYNRRFCTPVARHQCPEQRVIAIWCCNSGALQFAMLATIADVV